jgi:YidC/Oxa1 family membrane protein insertase
MKKNNGFKLLALGVGLFILSSCTQSFCSVEDTARVMYAYDGVGTVTDDGYQVSPQLATILTAAESQGMRVPTDEFFESMDEKLLTEARIQANNVNITDAQALEQFGYLKFAGFVGNTETLWANFTKWNNELKIDLGFEQAANTQFVGFYQSEINRLTANYRACIAIQDGNYGPTGGYYFTSTTWGEAFDRGLIEGLLVYPVAWMVENFANFFSGNLALGEGWGQVFAIFFTTLIVRSLLLTLTFKSTMATQKMSMLQPELAKIQLKYPNSNTNQYDRQQLAQAQMALYSKHGINPFGSILIALFQFPIFIAVWGAMTGSAVLSTGSWLGLNLNASVGDSITGGVFFSPGWWTALGLFTLMSLAQFVSMKLPMWLSAKKSKSIEKTVKSPAADQASSQTKLMSNMMLIMIIFMGFSLPSAMGIYWFFGALISVGQTFITRKAMAMSL